MKMKALFGLEPGRPIAYYAELVPFLGSVNAVLLFCQLVYWRGKGRDRMGWIYKTSEELQIETGLTVCQQRSARELLRDLGFVEEKLKSIPPKVHFRLCEKRIIEEWEKYLIKSGKLAKKIGENYARRRTGFATDITESTQRVITKITSGESAERILEMNRKGRISDGKGFTGMKSILAVGKNGLNSYSSGVAHDGDGFEPFPPQRGLSTTQSL